MAKDWEKDRSLFLTGNSMSQLYLGCYSVLQFMLHPSRSNGRYLSSTYSLVSNLRRIAGAGHQTLVQRQYFTQVLCCLLVSFSWMLRGVLPQRRSCLALTGPAPQESARIPARAHPESHFGTRQAQHTSRNCNLQKESALHLAPSLRGASGRPENCKKKSQRCSRQASFLQSWRILRPCALTSAVLLPRLARGWPASRPAKRCWVGAPAKVRAKGNSWMLEPTSKSKRDRAHGQGARRKFYKQRSPVKGH